MKDGHLNKCKECTKSDTKRDYWDNRDKHIAYEKERQKCPERRARQVEYNRRRRENNPEKARAWNAVTNAIRDGRLVKGACIDCGATERVEGHHEDYSKPLVVIWLCRACHKIRHGKAPF